MENNPHFILPPFLTRKYVDELTFGIVGAAIEVHQRMGPGLKEEVYEECMTIELDHLEIPWKQQYRFRPHYRGIQLKTTSVMDLIIDDLIVVELKSVAGINELHKAQALSYINLIQLPKALILNFNCTNISSKGKQTMVNSIYAGLPAK
jgi:GxxExxY protein